MSNFTTGQKLKVKVSAVSQYKPFSNTHGTFYPHKFTDQTTGKEFSINKATENSVKVGEEFWVQVDKVDDYGVKVKKVQAPDAVGGSSGNSSRGGGYVAFEPRQQASINASTAINGAIELIKADKIKFEQLVATADRIFDYIQSKVLAIDPNAYKMPVAASSTNESTNTQSTTQSSNSVAVNSLKQDDGFTAVSNDDELPW